jgi:hypothetical protein
MPESRETVSWIGLHAVALPLKTPISDAKVPTGRTSGGSNRCSTSAWRCGTAA